MQREDRVQQLVDDFQNGYVTRRGFFAKAALMTALRAKGKEFDVVILLDVNDEIWPNRNARTPAEKEAERRVFYVAFTRARKRILMFVSDHFRNREAVPSPFIEELGLTVG